MASEMIKALEDLEKERVFRRNTCWTGSPRHW